MLYRRFVEWFKARQRGEHRTAPYGQFGRVYTKAKPVMKLKIYRAATDTWEDGPEVKVK